MLEGAFSTPYGAGIIKLRRTRLHMESSVETTKNLLDKNPKVLELLTGLNQYIQEDPVPRSAELERLGKQQGARAPFGCRSVASIAFTRKIFADKPEIIPKLVQAEKHLNLRWLADHLRTTNDPGNLERIARLANASPVSELLSPSYLRVLGHLDISNTIRSP